MNPSDQRAALKLAIFHLEHMAAWIGRKNTGYSFEGLGEDMPTLLAALAALDGIEPRRDALIYQVVEDALSRIPAQHQAAYAEERFRRAARALADAIMKRELPVVLESTTDDRKGVTTHRYLLVLSTNKEENQKASLLYHDGVTRGLSLAAGIVNNAASRYAAKDGSCAGVISGALFDAARGIQDYRP